MQAREMFSEKSSGASHAVKIERAEDNQTCKTARAWEGLGRDIVSSSGARLAGCVCGGGGVFGGAVVDIRRRATMNNASKEAGRCSASGAGAARGNHEQKRRAIWTVSSAADHRRG